MFGSDPKAIGHIGMGHIRPGLGHKITTLCYVLEACRRNDVHPLLFGGGPFGPWEKFFKPVTKNQLSDEDRERLTVAEFQLRPWMGVRVDLFGDDWQKESESILAMFRHIWRFNKETRAAVEQAIVDLELPAGYVSVHVRRGDKDGQFPAYGRISTEKLGEMIREYVDGQVAFVMTDEFEVVEILRELGVEVFTLCNPRSNGHTALVRNLPDHMMNLLTEITVASRSDHHYQTVRSDLSKIIRFRRDDKECTHLLEPEYSMLTWL